MCKLNRILLIIALCFSGSLSAAGLGTLLLTKSERNILDQMRRRGEFNGASVNKQQQPLRLDGVVLRAGHEPVVFVNGKSSLLSRKINNSVHIHTSNIQASHPRVLVTKNRSSRYMKPGQVWLPSTRKITEEYKFKQGAKNE